MNSLIKKIIITAMFITIILTGITTVNAATTTISLSSNDKIVAGGTITININVSSPVYGISTKLAYDKDAFESVTVASSVATSANLANNTIVIDSETAMPAGTIGTITLKVKSTISKNEAVVSLSNVKATDESLNTQTLNSPNITLKTNANSHIRADRRGRHRHERRHARVADGKVQLRARRKIRLAARQLRRLRQVDAPDRAHRIRQQRHAPRAPVRLRARRARRLRVRDLRPEKLHIAHLVSCVTE